MNTLKGEVIALKCEICGKEINKKSFSIHLKKEHNITSKEYYDQYIKKENEGKCATCGKETKFKGIFKGGYNKFCSVKCSANNKEVREKAKKTNLERYGAENPFQSKEIKQKIKETNLEKYGAENVFASKYGKKKVKEALINNYGVTNASQSPEIKNRIKQTNLEKYGVESPSQSEEIKQKIEQTNLEKYGVRCTLQSEEVQDKIRATNLEKYGVECVLQSEEIKEKIKRTNLEKYGYEYASQSPEVISKMLSTKKNKIKEIEKDGYTQVKDLVEKYGQMWPRIIQDIPYRRESDCVFVPNEYIEKIKKYATDGSGGKSVFEEDVKDFISNIYNGEIIYNTRSVIYPKETDIYIPEKRLAIECDGIYFHSTTAGSKDRNYHLNKTKECSALNIRLIHITDWEWNNKRDICKSIIASALGLFQERIYARQCQVKEVTNSESINFLNENHIQGGINSSIRLGLYFNNKLVQLITLGKSRFKKGEYELLRMCTKLNIQVIGGLSKLMSHLPSCIDEVISYVDRSKFTGNGYINSGWTLIGETEPGYSYYRGDNKYSRQQCQKHKLKDFLGEENFNENLTEVENMLRNNFLQVYDCGNFKMKLSK